MTESERLRRVFVIIRALRIIWAGLSVSKDIHEYMAAIEIFSIENDETIAANLKTLESTVSKAQEIIGAYDQAMMGATALDYFQQKVKPKPTPRPKALKGA